jgi:hypothetical protein
MRAWAWSAVSRMSSGWHAKGSPAAAVAEALAEAEAEGGDASEGEGADDDVLAEEAVAETLADGALCVGEEPS